MNIQESPKLKMNRADATHVVRDERNTERNIIADYVRVIYVCDVVHLYFRRL